MTSKWSDLPVELEKPIRKTLKRLGFRQMTPVQVNKHFHQKSLFFIQFMF